jgi:hypothetical protein
VIDRIAHSRALTGTEAIGRPFDFRVELVCTSPGGLDEERLLHDRWADALAHAIYFGLARRAEVLTWEA